MDGAAWPGLPAKGQALAHDTGVTGTLTDPHAGAEAALLAAFARGEAGARAPFPPEDLLETGIGVYLRGLGLVPPDQ